MYSWLCSNQTSTSETNHPGNWIWFVWSADTATNFNRFISGKEKTTSATLKRKPSQCHCSPARCAHTLQLSESIYHLSRLAMEGWEGIQDLHLDDSICPSLLLNHLLILTIQRHFSLNHFRPTFDNLFPWAPHIAQQSTFMIKDLNQSWKIQGTFPGCIR